MNVVRQISGRLEEARKRDIFSPTYSLWSGPLTPRFARALEMDFFPTLAPRDKTAAEKGAVA